MPSLRIIYDVEGWAFHREAVALQKHAPPDFDVSLAPLRRPEDAAAALGTTPADLVFLLAAGKTNAVGETLREHRWPTRFIVCWSLGVPNGIGTFLDLYPKPDGWVINNQESWDMLGRLPRTRMIPNGVDLDLFTVQRPPEARKPKVLWTGSELHRRLKGYDDFMQPLRRKLRALGIDCDLLLVDSYGDQKRTAAQMAEWYNSGTVLVCASESEGTPNPALEAAACGCTVVSTRVGNMPELIRDDVNGYLIDRDVNALLAGIQAASQNYVRLSRAMQSDIRAWDWKGRSAEFFEFFREVLDERHVRAARKRNLSKAVTAFVTTVGAPTFPMCLERLREQDCSFRLQIIDRVAPMNVAFQRMMDECRTPYYVQVDEDMLLYPHAVRTLYEALAKAEPNVAMCLADLYDVHLARCILGVKIFRHDIVRRYPFEAIDSFETAQLARMAKDGYTYLQIMRDAAPLAGPSLGLHGMQWTPQSIYERYATLARRRCTHPKLSWLDEYGPRFLRRLLAEPSAENYFALQGFIAGALTGVLGEAPAKDYRTYDALPGFQQLRMAYEELRGSAPDATTNGDGKRVGQSRGNGSITRKRRPKATRRRRAAKSNGDGRVNHESPNQ